jgi:hypothetical protein
MAEDIRDEKLIYTWGWQTKRDILIQRAATEMLQDLKKALELLQFCDFEELEKHLEQAIARVEGKDG